MMGVMEDFEAYLESEGLARKSRRTYVNAVDLALKSYPDDPVRILSTRRYAKKTRVTYRAALKRYAEFIEDRDMIEDLSSKRVQKLLSLRGGAPPKRTKALSSDEVAGVLTALEDAYRGVEGSNAWVWPCLSLMVKLALRAQVDLTWINRRSIQEALSNGSTLTIVTKGGSERDLPISTVLDELDALVSIPGWETIDELISPHADPRTRHQAAYEAIRRKMREVAETAGLDPSKVHTHRFRHAAAQRMLEMTNDLFLVRDLLGHATARTTEIYLQTRRTQEVGDALERMYEEKED